MTVIRWYMAALFFAVSLIVGCGERTPADMSGAAVEVHPTAQPPVIDGILTDAAWERAEPVPLVSTGGGGAPRFPSTTFRVLYNSTYLYVGFECQDTDAASTVAVHDGRVSDGDCVSLFLDVLSDSTTYYAIDVAPSGVVHDAYVLTGRDGDVRILSSWECANLRVSASVYGGGAQPGTQDRFWTVEMAIPLAELVTAKNLPPNPGDMWRFNACRVDVAETRALAAISPTGADTLHRPQTFSRLIFR